MAETRDQDFFVGYLPMSRRQRRFVLTAGALLLLLVSLAGLVLAHSTQGASRGHFAFGQQHGLVGVLSARPTATLWTIDPSAEGGVRGSLLVRQGKFGLGASAAQFDGHAVRIDGYTIERDGHRMIELGGAPVLADLDLPPAERARILARTAKALGEVTLIGEIVDSKCYLGRMRPGDRRTHRACAQLCIAGGIPPLLVGHDASGQETQYVLAARDGGPIFHEVLPFVAEPVQVTGELVRDGDVLVLRTDVAHITRL
jgi:hypothetical protein